MAQEKVSVAAAPGRVVQTLDSQPRPPCLTIEPHPRAIAAGGLFVKEEYGDRLPEIARGHFSWSSRFIRRLPAIVSSHADNLPLP